MKARRRGQAWTRSMGPLVSMTDAEALEQESMCHAVAGATALLGTLTRAPRLIRLKKCRRELPWDFETYRPGSQSISHSPPMSARDPVDAVRAAGRLVTLRAFPARRRGGARACRLSSRRLLRPLPTAWGTCTAQEKW